MKKNTIQNILVPVDFSELSIQAIENARHLTRRFGATIHLVHVHEYYYPVGFMSPGAAVPMSMTTFQEDSEARAEAELRKLAAKYGIAPTHCYLRTEVPIYNEICRVASAIKADLIVMPTHGRTGLKHTFLGSTAERVVQHSPCPVFIVRRSGRASASGRIDNILVPVDFSRCSFEGLKYAIQFADKVAARILVFHVLYLGYAYTADGFAMYDLFELQKAAREEAERQMAKFVREARFGGVKYETVVAIGLPVEEICAVAEKKDVDLIVTSTHGRTGFEHVLIGSTAEHVVQHATRPVLIVPAHAEVRARQLPGTTQLSRKPARKVTPRLAKQQKAAKAGQFAKKYRKGNSHPFPERRQTNRFRETHPARTVSATP